MEKAIAIHELSKEDIWQNALLKVESITDGMNLGIEKEIREPVAAMMANGFITTGSCGGHSDGRGTPYPWIDIGDLLYSNDRYKELDIKAFNNQKKEYDLNLLTDTEQKEFNSFKVITKESNKISEKKCIELLKKFYEDNLIVDGQPKLTLEGDDEDFEEGWHTLRLLPEGVDDTESASAEEKERKLLLYRGEFTRFTEFLKNIFFES